MSLKKIIKDIGIIGFSKILISISGILLIPVLTRTLGASGYGLWIQARVTISVVVPIILLGLDSAVPRIFPSKDTESVGKDFSSLVFLTLLVILPFSIALFSFPSFLADLFFDGEEFVVRFVALTLIVWSFDKLFMRVYRAFREMKTYAILRVLTRYAELILASFLVITGYGLFGALAAVVIIRTILFLTLWVNLSRRLGIHIPKLSRTREYLNYGIPTIPSGISYWIMSSSDRYLIAFFLGTAFVGYYSPAYQIGKALPFMLAEAVYIVLKPTLSKYYDEGETKRVKSVLKLSLKYLIVFSVPYFFGALLFHQEITALISTPQIAREGSFIVIYTALLGIIYIFYKIYNIVLILEKKMKTVGAVKTTAAFLNFAGNLVLIPYIEILGAVMTTLIAYSFTTIIYFAVAKKYIDLDIQLTPYFKILLSSGLMFAVLLMLSSFTTVSFLLLIPLGVVIYFGVMFAIQGIKRDEYNFIMESYRKK